MCAQKADAIYDSNFSCLNVIKNFIPKNYSRETRLYVHKKTYTKNILGSFIHNNQKLAAKQMFINRKTDKQFVIMYL